MTPLVEEWIAKAEADLRAARLLLGDATPGQHDLVCYHAQQCAEKYLKACIQERGIAVPRTHHLPTLIGLLGGPEVLASQRAAAATLSQLAVAARYPGVSARPEDAARALETAERLRAAARQVLALE